MDLSQAILKVLLEHRGYKNRIRRKDLRWQLISLLGYNVTDREMREVILALRTQHQDGALICSTTGEGGGYWMLSSLAEIDAYIASERSRIKKTSHKLSIQSRRAKAAFGKQKAMGI